MQGKHDEEFEHGQFQGIVNKAQKKLIEVHQSNEFTKISKSNEGYCYMCFKKDFVSATIIDICFPCASKRGMEPILAIVKRLPEAFCYVCGKYSQLVLMNNAAQINVRLCKKCTVIVRKRGKYFRTHGGIMGVNPFWKHIQKEFGQDHAILFQEPASMRK